MSPSSTDDTSSDNGQKLRHAPPWADSGADPSVTQLLHELELLHVELQLQNDTLAEAFNEAATAREKYQALFDLAPVGFYTLTPESLILEVNDRGAQMLGLHRDAAVGHHLSDFVAADGAAEFAFLMDRLWGNAGHASAQSLQIKPAPPSLPLYVNIKAHGMREKNSGEHCVQMVWMDVSREKAARDDALCALRNSGFGDLV